MNLNYVSTILNGYQKPSSKTIKKIIKLTNGEVNANSFFEKELAEVKQNNQVQPIDFYQPTQETL